MKLTNRKLRQLIKEELESILTEQPPPPGAPPSSSPEDLMDMIGFNKKRIDAIDRYLQDKFNRQP